ncbi:uncharacterized protein A1O5_06190 [Cladophialophora psammophila CBS 110553]|uniref:Uncharacterized protein n=1 Tax=Cladophialophora psammophila CBS 110553 TaxID=1182543 RepID=W9X2N2_9EURO|nr:uncharacterized protein A1O5_06190 [Cladophialophora psammophila CBS 110553]EXJ71196.1 hypothetical protein A1O5_06190 [Cladophialophora psammophila CBS 110553]
MAAVQDTNVMPEPWFNRQRVAHAVQPFIIGGASGIVATTCIHPIDVVKVRLQLAGPFGSTSARPSAFSVAKNIVTQGRLLDLYQGISAGYLRQVVYGTARLGFFYTFEDALKRRALRHNREITFPERGLAGLIAGGLGSLIGTPTEVALIRMQSEGAKPPHERLKYRSVFDALARITRTEGIRALWSGTSPTVIRACSTNFGQLTFFSESKHQLSKRTNLSPQAQSLIASAIAGTFAATLSLPFDFVKTRLQFQTRQPNGTAMYRGTFDCFVKVARTEGLTAFYRGFVPYYFRMAPHA